MSRIFKALAILSAMATGVIGLSLMAPLVETSQTIVNDLNVSNANNATTSSAEELSYDTQNMTHRSAKEEWQPHQAQTAMSNEWWYFTSLLHDSSGNKYLLFHTLFKFDGKDVVPLPPLAMMLGPNRTAIQPQVELSNYNTGFHYYASDFAIVDPKQIWKSKTHTLSYSTPNYTGSWRFDGENNNNMTAILKSQKLSYDLNIQDATPHQQVMWSKDRTYNKEGFIQEGLPGNVSFYYSLPRLMVTGKLTYLDESGINNKTLDVAGIGWVDRQWGDFKTYAWEWASFRFDNGARLNLYSFENANQVATYQKPDGSLQWFDNFTIRQNGYDKLPNGQWAALGWSYDFPVNIEGSMHYTVIPFSKNDWICDASSFCFIEGAGQLVNDTTGKQVGSSVNESMDIRLLKNGPYDVNQH